jgi:predicted PurR-regulated permease PerM
MRSTIPSFEEKKVISLFAVLGYLGLVIGIISLLYVIRVLIAPLVVSTVFAMTLIPEVDRMERRGWKRGVAIGCIYLLFLLCCGLLIRCFVLASGQLGGLVSSVVPNVTSMVQKSTHAAAQWMVDRHISGSVSPTWLKPGDHLQSILGSGVQWVTAAIPAIAANLIWLFIVPIITFFILLDFHKILGKVLILVPSNRRTSVFSIVTDVTEVFGNYVRGMMLVMLLDMAVIYVTLCAAHLTQYALPLALSAGILYTIPYFGAIVSTLGIGLIALATHGLVSAIVLTLVMIFIHQVIFDNVIGPRILGGSVNLHPLLTLLALMAGGAMFGIGGTLLAVPIAAALQVVLVHMFPQLKTDVVSIHPIAAVEPKHTRSVRSRKTKFEVTETEVSDSQLDPAEESVEESINGLESKLEEV